MFQNCVFVFSFVLVQMLLLCLLIYQIQKKTFCLFYCSIHHHLLHHHNLLFYVYSYELFLHFQNKHALYSHFLCAQLVLFLLQLALLLFSQLQPFLLRLSFLPQLFPQLFLLPLLLFAFVFVKPFQLLLVSFELRALCLY